MLFNPNRTDLITAPTSDYYFRRYKFIPQYFFDKPEGYETLPAPLPEESGLDSILSSKKDLIVQRLEMLTLALQERKDIQADVIQAISSDQTRCQSRLFAIEGLYDQKLNADWEKRKLDLEREARQHRTAYFRDLSTIHKELRDTMLDYIKEKQMEDMFR